MKKVKKMAFGGMNASAPLTQSQLQASVPRTQSQMQAAQRGGFSSTPTMGGVGKSPMPFTPSPRQKIPPPPTGLNVQKVDNRPAPPGTPALQRFSSPEGYKQAEAAYRQMQQQQQLANSVGRLPAPSGGPANSQTASPMMSALNVFGKPMKKGGVVKSSASKRADGCAQRGKTKGRIV